MLDPLSIVVPAYNEGARLGQSLASIFTFLDAHARGSELIVVDDGSRDNTVEIATRALEHAGSTHARLISNETNRGKGFAVRVGLAAAKHRIAVFTDADLSTPIAELPRLVEPIRERGFHLVFGSRALDRSLIGTRQPWRREQGGRVFNLLVRLATGLPFWDTQCGFKALQMDVCRPLVESMTIDRFAFDVEMIYIAQLAGAKLLELPVRWDHNDGSKVHVVRDSLLMVNEMLRVRRHERAGAYIDAVAEMKAGIAAQSGATAILKSAGSTESETDVRTAGAHV